MGLGGRPSANSILGRGLLFRLDLLLLLLLLLLLDARSSLVSTRDPKPIRRHFQPSGPPFWVRQRLARSMHCIAKRRSSEGSVIAPLTIHTLTAYARASGSFPTPNKKLHTVAVRQTRTTLAFHTPGSLR